MTRMMLPNALRIILLVSTILSFVPQLRLLFLRRDSSGLSLYYVLFNLIVSTELFTMAFFWVVNANVPDPRSGSEVFARRPANTGDWINLAQLTAVWVLWLLTFALTIIFLPSGNRRHIAAAMAAYTFHLLISVVPIFADAYTADPGYEMGRSWNLGYFSIGHVLLTPVFTALAAAALLPQALAIGLDTRALSPEGLAAQAILFALLALSWPWRLWVPPNLDSMNGTWYELVGFVPVDHAVFATVQAVLLFIAVRRRQHGEAIGREGEPLILELLERM